MNDRQQKKLRRKTAIKIRKLCPKHGDIVVLQPNMNEIDLSTLGQFIQFYGDNHIFGKASAVIVPCTVKSINNKESAQKMCDEFQKQIDEMR